METVVDRADAIWQQLLIQLASPAFYLQIAIVVVALGLAWLLAGLIGKRVRFLRDEPKPGVLLDVRKSFYGLRNLLLPFTAALVLGIATPICVALLGEAWLVRFAQGLAFIFLIYSVASHLISNITIILFIKWLGFPLAILYMFGWLDDAIEYLDSISFELGNIEISLYAILRTFVFGVILFWLGRASNATGQRVIRNQSALWRCSAAHWGSGSDSACSRSLRTSSPGSSY